MRAKILSPETKKELLIDELQTERGVWLPLKLRYERTNKRDAQLGLEYQMSNMVMDRLLEKLFEANVVLEPSHEPVTA